MNSRRPATLARRPHRALRRSPRAVWRLLRLTPLGAGVATLVGLPPISAWAQATGVAANVIKPDGRTATQQQVLGTRTDITTGTVRGDNAFNSFSRFEVGQGQTVNVHVPAAAQRVINIVTDAPVKVDGVLNGLKNGSISGNLVFADPMGMVVSKGGVVNVNSLQVVATTREHADAMLDGQGRIGEAAVQQLLDGKAPRSAEGRVQIDGKVNALERVRIEARRIDIAGRINAGADAAHDAAFRAAVSSNGLANATGMVERGGVIELVADESVRVGGALDASQRQAVAAPEAPQAGLGGTVRVLGDSIELTPTAHVDVSGLAGGGTAVFGSMSLPAAAAPADAPAADAAPAPVSHSVVVAAGSVVQADALERGDGGRVQYLSDGGLDWGGFTSSRGGALMGHGGFIEVSGRRRVQVHGLVDTTARKGDTGTLLIDPDDLYITNGAAGSSSCLANGTTGDCTVTVGTIAGLAASSNLVLQADKTITFGGSDGSAVNLDLSGVLTLQGSQTISFTSHDITFNAGSRLVTGGGNVKLYALGGQSTGIFGTGQFSYSSNIGWGPLSIGEKVDGGKIWMKSGSAVITRGVTGGTPDSGGLARRAGDVTLRAGTLQLDSGSSILAHAESGSSMTGGSVELTAYSLQQWNLGKATATAQVTLAGTVKANDIKVNSVARAEASPDGAWGFATELITGLFGAATGLGAAYHETDADARIDVMGTAVLDAKATLDIAAASVNKAAGSVKVFTVDESGGNVASAAALYVKTAGEANLQVKNGAQLTSGGKATLGAYNDATAKSTVKVLSNNSLGGVVVGYLEADVSATANVEAGAKLNVSALELAALQTGNMRNQANTTVAQQEAKEGQPAPPTASVGAAVAVSEIKAHATAHLGANLDTVGDVTVVADSSLWQNYTAARNDVGGDPTVADKIQMKIGAYFTDKAKNNSDWLKGFMEAKSNFLGSTTKGAPPIKAGAVITVNETELTSKAQIGDGVKIVSSGQVAVVAQTEDRSVHNIAESKVNTKNAPTNEPVVNAAVAVGLYTHGAEATVGANADISSKVFGTYADVYQPLDVTWLAGFSVDGLRDPATLFAHFAPPNFGMPQFVFTSWATALSEQDKIKDPNGNDTAAVAGSVNWTAFTNTAKSWVGSGARITASDADRAWSVSWTAPPAPLLDGDADMKGDPSNAFSNILLETQTAVDAVKWLEKNSVGEITGFFNGGPVVLGITLRNSLDFTKAVDVKARNQSAFLTFTGQPVDFGMTSVNLGSQGGKLAVGGAFNYAGAEHTTVAGIDDGAVVRALAGTVSVDALGQDRIIAVAPTAGTGKGAAVNLIAAYSELDNTTVALLSNKADVKSKSLSVTATEDVSVWSAAGAAAFGASTAAVGLAVAVNELDGRTLATIGDASNLSLGPVRPDGFHAGTGTGAIDVSSVKVVGLTQGTSGAVAASAASVSTEDQSQDNQVDKDDKSALSKKWEALKTKTSKIRSDAVTKLASDGTGKVAQARNWLSDKIKAKEGASDPQKPYQTTKFSLSAAGSATVNLGNLDTSSVIDSASLNNQAAKAAGSTDASLVTVRAVNDTHQYSVSGSGALMKLNAPETKAGYGVAGAIAIDLEDNDTLARIVDSSVKDYGRVAVESLASGQRISVGLGLAGSSGSKPAYMLSASYSMTDSDNSTVSAIDGGSVTSTKDDFRTGVEVLSYDKTETGVGAGALTVQKNKGGAAGASIGVALVHNDVESRVAGMSSDRLSTVDVRAYDPVVLGIGAASLGISTDKKSTTIEGAVTYGEVENTTRAQITDRNGVASDIKANGSVTVQASDVTPALFKTRFTDVLAADGTPAADSEYDFGASLRSESSQESFGGQSIGTTQPGALLIGVAGGIAIASGNSASASAALSRVASVHESLLEGATVNARDVKVDATDSTLMVNVGVGVAGTGDKIAATGSLAVTLDETRATARVGNAGKTTSVTTTGTGGLGVTSATSDKSFAVAGAVAISTKGSAGGLAGTVGVDSSVAEAQIKSATIDTGAAAAQVLGTTSSQHVSVAAAGGYGANASINGSFVINFDTARTTASVSDASVTAASLAVKAGDDAALAAQVYTGAGSLGFSKDVAGGAALTSNTVGLTRDATVDRSTLTLGSGNLDVQADSSVKMIGITIAGGGSKDVAFNGAISSNEIANKTTARVAGSTLTTTGNASVVSGDRSEMNYGTGAVSISGEAGIGAAIGFNLITNDVTAQFQGTDGNGLKAGTGVANVGNLRVASTSDERIVNATYGVAVGSSLGGAGSIAVNVIDSDVVAHIGRGADVHADGTVAVTATAQDDIKSFGGAVGLSSSGAGIGLSSTVNVVRGATEATVGADGEAQVKLDAKGNGSGLDVNDGTLTTAIPGVAKPGSDPTGFDGLKAMQDYDVTRAKMAEGKTTVKGVAVNATSMRHVLSFDTNVGGAVDGLGIGANAGAHVISSTTTAEVANASVNQRDEGAATQDVAVKSSSHHVMSTFGFSLGASGGAGGAAALGGDVFLTQTTARVRDSQVKAADDVTVKASNESAQSGVLAGIAAAGGGTLAGSTGVIVFDAGVEASILGGTTRAAGDVAVNAGNTSVMNMITGAGSLSGGLALAGAITVLVSDLDTVAYIGRDTDTGTPTKVSAGGDVEVKADSTTQVNTFTFAISGGGATSVAAIGAIGVATNQTKASARHADLEVGVPANWVYAASTDIPGGGTIGEDSGTQTVSTTPTGKLTVAATDHGITNQLSGAAGISFGGGGGVGGTVSVMVSKSNVAAELKSSEVDTKDLNVTSLNSQDQLAATVGVGASTDVGAGFAISLTMTGTGSPGSDAFGNASDSNSLGTKLMNRAAAIANTDRLGETGGTLSTADRQTVQNQSKRDLSGTLTQSGANSASAAIDASTVRADHDVTVQAQQETALKNIAGAAGVAGLAGMGGTVGVSYVYNASAAEVTGSNLTAGGALSITADSGDKGDKHALELMTIAGGVGFAGLGASVGVGHLENQVSAQASGTLKAGSVNLTATDSTSSKAENVAAAAGGGALGIAVSTIDRAGTVQAWVNKGGAGSQSVDAGSLSINASTAQDNDVVSRAVAAGLGISGNGAAGTINDEVHVSAGIGSNSAIHVGGSDLQPGQNVTVQATRGTSLDSTAEGVGVSGGVQIGASVALAKLGGSTEAKVGENVVFDAGSTLSVIASESGDNSLTATGSASGGGALVGANATVAQTRNSASTTATIGDGTLLPDGFVVLHASHAATQHADSSGVTVGGLLAVGANTSDAKTTASASATLGNVKTSAGRLGDLDVAAQGVDTTTAKAVAGGGGLISGQAATALVTDNTSTTATIAAAGDTAKAHPADYTLRGGALTLDATHTAMVRADSDTVNASAVGASGAITETKVNNSATATVGTEARLRGLGIAVTATNVANETGTGDNAAGAGGGVANGSAVVATTNFVTGATTDIQGKVHLDVIGDPSSDTVGRLVIVAGTDVNTHTQGSLNTGGVIDIPYAEIQSTTDATNTVTIGNGAELRSAGDIILGTSTLNRTSASALVKTYGGVGITGGTSTANAHQTDKIELKDNALLHAYGNVSIATGRNADNAVNLMQSRAVTDVYNNTVIPISYDNAANADITQNSSLILASTSKVQAGRSVYLRNFKGDQIVSADGEGHNPYLELFSTSSDDSNPSQSFTGGMTLNGTVTAGYYRLRDLTIAANGTLTQNVDNSDNLLPIVTFTMDGSGNYRNASNQIVDAALVLKPQGYIAKVDGFNPVFYYDANAQTKLGNVPNAALGAYVLPDLVVAGGNIEVDATSIIGSGTLRAQGGPLIQVENKSNRFLIANKLVIPDIDSGGGVSFTGSASKPSSLNVQQVDKGRTPAIDLHNSYDTAFGGHASDIVLQASDDGANTVRNLRGSFKMVNDNGNVWGSAPEALSVDIQVPNGTYVIESAGYYPLGGAPQGVWSYVDSLYRPNDINSFVDTAAYAFYVDRWDAATRAVFEATPAGANYGYSSLLQGFYNNKGSGISGYLFRANLGNQPTKGGNWYDGRYNFDILPKKTLTATWNGAPAGATKSPGLLANRVDITAAYIDINADIRAGTARDINVTVNNTRTYYTNIWDKILGKGTKYSFFECVASTTCRSFNGLYAEANGQYKVPASSLTYGASSPQLTVTYDPVTKRVSTAPIGTASAGSISLIGRILNSNADGSQRSKIELSTGTIQLNVNNQSGYAFEMPRIETGAATGDGVIRITDLNKVNAQYKPLTSWWVSKNGTDVDLYQSYTAATYVGLSPVTTGSGGATETTYDPQAGWRYQWTRSAKATRDFTHAAGSNKWWDFYATPWTFAYGASTPNWTTYGAGPVYDTSNTATYNTQLSQSTGFSVVNVTYSANGAAQRYFYVATSATLYQRSSVRADFGMDISFKGYASGGVTFTSNADTYLGNTVNNPTGDTTLTLTNGASLIARDGGLIRSRNLTLDAAGNVGGVGTSKALDVELSGSLNAKAGGNLVVNAAGALSLAGAQVGDGKQLKLKAVGDITSTGSGVTLSGYDVDFTSTGGRVGGANPADPLNINVKGIGPGVSQRGLLTVQSNGDVYLNLTGGDTRVAGITANDGNVTVKTNGSLFDAREAQGGNGRTDAELKELWEQTLKISGDKAASTQDYLQHTIVPLDQQVNRDYREYWNLRALGTLDGTGRAITLSSKGLATLRAQAAAAYGVTNPSDTQVNAWANTLLDRYEATFDKLLGNWQGSAAFQARDASFRFSADRYNEYWTLLNATDASHRLTTAGAKAIRQVAATVIGGNPTDAQLQAYVDQRLARLAQDFQAQLGANWASQAAFSAYDPSYRFSADSLLATYAYGTYWGADRLQNEIRQTAFGQSSGGATSIDHLNISGRKVTLTSTAANATLGRDNGYLTLNVGQPLSDVQRYALSQASAPGDVQVITNASGQITGLKVKDTRPFFVNAKTQFDANAPGQLYVLAQGALSIGSVLSNGSLRLTAQDGITNAGAAVAIKGTSLVLDGGSGGLGTAASPLLLNTPELTLARATDSVYLRQPSGSLVIDVVGSGKDVVLTLNNGALTQKQQDLLSLAGESLTLDVSGNVGTAARPLVVESRSGPFKLKAKDAWVNATGTELQLGDSHTLGFTLRALGTTDLLLSGDVVSDAAVQWLIGGDFLADANKSLTAAGNLALTASSVDMASGSSLVTTGGGLALSSTAGPTVLSTLTAKTGMKVDSELAAIRSRDADVTLTVKDAGAGLAFNSLHGGGDGIGGVAGGDLAAPLRVAADHLVLTSATGDVSLRLLNPSVSIDAATATAGSLKFDAAGQLALAGNVSAGQDATLKAAQGLTLAAGRTLDAGARLVVDAASITMGAGSRATAGDTAALTARSGDARLATVQAASELTVDAVAGTITPDAPTDQLIATAGRIALNRGNTGGLGIGAAGTPLRLSAAQVDARTAGGGIYLELLRNTALERALASTGDVFVKAGGDLAVTGEVKAGQLVDLDVTGALTATDRITAGADLKLEADRLDLGADLNAGGNAELTARVDELLVRTRLFAAGQVAMKSAGEMLAHDIEAGLDLDFDAGGPLRGDKARAGRALTVIRAPEFEMRELASGADMTLTVGNAKVDSLDAGGKLVLDAASARLGDAHSGGDATLTVTGALDITGTQGLVVGGATQVSADAATASRIESARAFGLAARTAKVDNLVGHGDAQLDVTGALTLGQARIDGRLVVSAEGADLGQLAVQGDALLRIGQALQLTSASVGGSFDMQAASAWIGTLDVGGSALLTVTSALDLARLTAGGRASLTADVLKASGVDATGRIDILARTAEVGTLVGRSDAVVRIEQALRMAVASTTGLLDVSAATAQLGTLQSGGAARLSAAGAMELSELIAGRSASVSADTLAAGRIEAGGTIDLSARTANVDTLVGRSDAVVRVNQGLTLNTATLSGNLDLNAGTATLGSVAVTGNARVAAGSAGITSLTTGGDMDVTVDNLTAQQLRSGGHFQLDGGKAAIDRLDATGAARLTLSTGLTLGSAGLGSTLAVQAATATLGTASVAGNAGFQVGQALRIDDGSFGADLAVKAGSATLGQVKVAGAADMDIAGGLQFTSLDVTRTLGLKARSLQGGSLSVGGNASLATQGDLALDQGLFGADLQLSAENARLGTLKVTGNTGLAVRGSLALARMDAAGNLDLQAATLGLGTLNVGGAARLTTPGELTLDEAHIGDRLDLLAGSATLGRIGVTHDALITVTGPLSLTQLDVGGSLGLQAASLAAGGISTGGAARLAVSGHLALVSGQFGGTLDLTADDAHIGRAHVTGTARLQAAELVADNLAGDAAVKLDATRRLTLGAGQFGSDLTLTAHDADLGTLTVGGNTLLQAEAGMKLAGLDAARTLTLQAASLDAQRVHAVGAAQLRTGGNLALANGRFDAGLGLAADSANLGDVNVNGAVDLAVAQRLTLARFEAGQAIDVKAGQLLADTLLAKGRASLQAGAALQLDHGDFGADLALVADTATLGTVKVAGAAQADVAGLLKFTELDVGQAVGLKAGSIDGGSLNATGAARLQAAGALALSQGSLGSTLDVQAQDATVGAVQVGGDATLAASGLHVTDSLATGGALALKADAVDAARLQAGTTLAVQATRAQLGALKTGGAATLTTTAALTVADGTVGGTLAVQAADASFTALAVTGDATLKVDGQLQARSLDAAGALGLSAAKASLGRTTVAGVLDARATQQLDIDQLTATGASQLQAASLTGGEWKTAALSVDAGKAVLASLTASGDVDLKLADTLRLDQARLAGQLGARAAAMQLGDVSVAGNARLRATGLLQARRLDVGGTLDVQAGSVVLGAAQGVTPQADPANPSLKVGGVLTLAADQATLADALVGGAATLTVRDALDLQGSSGFHAGLAATAGRIGIQAATVNGDAVLTSAGAADIAQLDASGKVTVTAAGNLRLDKLAATQADLSATTLALGNLQLSDGLKATATQGITADSLTATKTLTLQSNGAVQAKLVNSATVDVTGGQQVGLDLLKAGTATLRSATQIALAGGEVATIDLRAPVIHASLKAAGGDLLTSRIGGADGAPASDVTMAVDGLRWQVPVLDATKAAFSSTGRQVQFDQARIGDTMTLTTPDGLIALTSGKVQVLPGVDVQLYAPAGDFVLMRDGLNAYTTALAVVYKPTQFVSAPNTGLSPLAAATAAANGGAARLAPVSRPGQLALSFEALLRNAPTAAGEDEEDELVGKLEF